MAVTAIVLANVRLRALTLVHHGAQEDVLEVVQMAV